MSIPQLYNTVDDLGSVRAYWASSDDTFHYGERGNLVIRNEELVFISDLNPHEPIIVDFNNEVHSPAISHYSWRC